MSLWSDFLGNQQRHLCFKIVETKKQTDRYPDSQLGVHDI
jgi:hypothetical protein